MELVEEETIGAAWLEVSRRILAAGELASYDGLATKELTLVTLVARRPDPDDALVAAHGDPDWAAWMERNFTSRENVAELGDARSYGARLRDRKGGERGGRDQIAWVVERLCADPETRSATITTFEPETDTTYIPCVSLLDFWLRDGALELVVYAHSLDFGKKAYGNLVELARLQHEVAARVGNGVGVGVGQLVIHAKSAHVYEPEWTAMERIAPPVRT